MASLSADPAEFRRARFRQLQRLSRGEATALTILRTRRFLADFPDHGAAWLLLGISLVELARHEEAEAALRRSLSLAPRHKRRILLGMLGHLFAFRGQRKRAAYWFQSGIKADRKVAWCRIFLGELLASNGRLREAEVELRQATRCREGRIEEAYFHLGRVLRGKEKFEAAAACLREAIQLRPRYRQARSALRRKRRLRQLQRLSDRDAPALAS